MGDNASSPADFKLMGESTGLLDQKSGLQQAFIESLMKVKQLQLQAFWLIKSASRRLVYRERMNLKGQYISYFSNPDRLKNRKKKKFKIFKVKPRSNYDDVIINIIIILNINKLINLIKLKI